MKLYVRILVLPLATVTLAGIVFSAVVSVPSLRRRNADLPVRGRTTAFATAPQPSRTAARITVDKLTSASARRQPVLSADRSQSNQAASEPAPSNEPAPSLNGKAPELVATEIVEPTVPTVSSPIEQATELLRSLPSPVRNEALYSSSDFAKLQNESNTRGEMGGDLGYLRKFYTGPQLPDESNHYIDLWSGHALPALAHLNGLTNNHTLFVDSHGKGSGYRGSRYVFYPSHELWPAPQPPNFTVRDLATVVGAENLPKIHNVVIAGCNLDGAFSAQEVRKYFVNATNVTHTPAGQLGFKPMFYQAIVMQSADIKILYAQDRKQRIGGTKYEVVDSPKPGATRLSPYVAELFVPGARKPFRTVVAGREILDLAK